MSSDPKDSAMDDRHDGAAPLPFLKELGAERGLVGVTTHKT
jgi:hypothetical protein